MASPPERRDSTSLAEARLALRYLFNEDDELERQMAETSSPLPPAPKTREDSSTSLALHYLFTEDDELETSSPLPPAPKTREDSSTSLNLRYLFNEDDELERQMADTSSPLPPAPKKREDSSTSLTLRYLFNEIADAGTSPPRLGMTWIDDDYEFDDVEDALADLVAEIPPHRMYEDLPVPRPDPVELQTSRSDGSDFDYKNYDPFALREAGEEEFNLRAPQQYEPFFPKANAWTGKGAIERFDKFWSQADDYPLLYVEQEDEEDYDPRPIGPNRPDVKKFEIDEQLNEDMDDVLHEMINNTFRYGVEIPHDIRLPEFYDNIRERKEKYTKKFQEKYPLYQYPQLPEDFYAEELRRTKSEEEARAAQVAFEARRRSQMQEPIRLPAKFALTSTGYQSLAGPTGSSGAGKHAASFKGKGKGKARSGDLNALFPDFDGPRTEFSECKGGKIKIVTDREFSYGGLSNCIISGTLYAETADVSPAFKSIVGVIDRKQDQVDASYEEQHVLQLELSSLKQQLTDLVKDNDFDHDAFVAEEKEIQAKLERAKKALAELADDMEIGYVTGFKEDHGTPESLISQLEVLMAAQAADIPALEAEYKKLVDAKDQTENLTNHLNNDLENKVRINKAADKQFTTLKCRKDALFDKCEQIRGNSDKAFEAYKDLYSTVDDLMKDNAVLTEINKRLAKGVKFEPEGRLVQEKIIEEIVDEPEEGQDAQLKAIIEAGRARVKQIKEASKQGKPAPTEQVSRTKSDLMRRLAALKEGNKQGKPAGPPAMAPAPKEQVSRTKSDLMRRLAAVKEGSKSAAPAAKPKAKGPAPGQQVSKTKSDLMRRLNAIKEAEEKKQKAKKKK